MTHFFYRSQQRGQARRF